MAKGWYHVALNDDSVLFLCKDLSEHLRGITKLFVAAIAAVERVGELDAQIKMLASQFEAAAPPRFGMAVFWSCSIFPTRTPLVFPVADFTKILPNR